MLLVGRSERLGERGVNRMARGGRLEWLLVGRAAAYTQGQGQGQGLRTWSGAPVEGTAGPRPVNQSGGIEARFGGLRRRAAWRVSPGWTWVSAHSTPPVLSTAAGCGKSCCNA